LRQYDSAGDDRSRERRHAGFIHARDHSITLRPELDLESQQEVQSLAFGAILPVTFANAFGELMRALPPVDLQSFK